MKKLCITLADRIDRRILAEDEFRRHNLNVDFVDGIRLSPGWMGCRESHLSCLNMCNGIFAIFEDDVIFMSCWKKTVRKAMLQLPKDWDALYLGATLNEPLERYSENLFRLRKGWTTHAIIYNNQNGIVDYILNNADSIRKIDVFLVCVQDLFNVYLTYPMVATQRPGYSDIINNYTDYSQIQERYERYTASLV